MGRTRPTWRWLPHHHHLVADHHHGWLVLQRHVELASAFAATHFRHLANPFSQTAYRRSGMWIHTLALMLIGVFVLIYLGLGYFRLMAG